ncbi:MFS transporter [Microbacterium terricola]|uniref:MFS transporter n=1 Tax=Microbacterium terricola TaxID=344163 RepID=A0ABM8E1U8_9MICO|nr:MFS transporter [Microbacterium terricola]UYK40487.1 MFS transporter [Microbacterium terricola]BDV31789.1 MFS transporter [Microbacterium terricola]
MTSPATDRRDSLRVIALTAVVVLAAAMLRSPFVAVAPVAREIGADLGVGAAVIGLLTSIPVLCFAVCAPLAVVLIRRGGVDFALTVAMAGAVVGCVIRSSGGIVVVMIGTVIIGAFLAVGNVVVPMIIARDYSAHRAHTMTGVYTSALNIGTMTVTFATAPLADEIGWRAAILMWAGFGIAALAVWIPLRGLRAALVPRPGSTRADGAATSSVARDGTTWLLAIAFCGQGFAFYGVTAWLPSLLADQGATVAVAGAIASVFQVGGIAGSLLTPLLTTRASLPVAATVVGLAWLFLPLGLLLAPSLAVVWCLIGGMAQGGGITLVFIMITAFGDDEHATAGRSGLVQGIGYGVAATGPILLGAVHEATGDWVIPLLTVIVATLLFLVTALIVARRLTRRR